MRAQSSRCLYASYRENLCIRLIGGRVKRSVYSGGPWTNEDREQPGKKPGERRGEVILPATWMLVGLVGRAPGRKLSLEMAAARP